MDGDTVAPESAAVRFPRFLLPMCAVAVGVAAVHLAQRLWHPVGPLALAWLPALPAIVGAAYGTWCAGRQRRLSAPVRRFWNQMALAILLVALGTLGRAVHSVTTPQLSLHGSDMAVYAASMLVAGWALCRLPLGLRNRSQRWTFTLDTLSVIIAVSLFAWQLSVRGALSDRQQSLSALLAVLITFALSLVAVFVLVKVALTGASIVDRGALRALGMALAVGALGSGPEPLLAERGQVSGTPLVVALCATFCVIAARRQVRAASGGDPAAPSRRPKRPFSALPYLAVAATDGLLLASVDFHDHRDRWVVAVGAVILTAVVAFRQLMAFLENSRLLGRLDNSLAELADRERRFRSLIQNSSDLTTITNAAGNTTYVSPAALAMTGAPAWHWVDRPSSDLVYPEDLPVTQRGYAQIVDTPGATAVYQVRLVKVDGPPRWIEVTSANLLHDPGVAGIVSNCRDITESREFQLRLHHEASHDALTGLANRTLFGERMRQELPDAAPDTVGVILIDLNDFKKVNDTMGHAAGDAVLVATGRRLRDSVRPEDTVARLGGDEFAVLLVGASRDAVDAVVRRIVVSFARPVSLGGPELLVSASIGIAQNGAGDTTDELQRQADVAMYAAKANRDGGSTRWSRYAEGMDASLAKRTGLEYDLRQAVAENQLHLLYQPIVLLADGRLIGVEALVRWQHPNHGLVMPAHFIALAERTGLIVPIGQWVLRTACAQARQWLDRYGDAAPGMSVNVSARQLAEHDFPAVVAAVLADIGLPAGRLTVEVTESIALSGDLPLDNLEALQNQGIRISLDDFGTGESSLGVLQSVPVDELKLDRAFTESASGPRRRNVAAAMIQLAQVLDLDAVAEGVETQSQAQRLIELGYQRAQGYYFGRPAVPADIEQRCADMVSVSH